MNSQQKRVIKKNRNNLTLNNVRLIGRSVFVTVEMGQMHSETTSICVCVCETDTEFLPVICWSWKISETNNSCLRIAHNSNSDNEQKTPAPICNEEKSAREKANRASERTRESKKWQQKKRTKKSVNKEIKSTNIEKREQKTV